MPNQDAGKAEYLAFIRNGLMWQLRRIKLGDDIEQSHMRNRQMIAMWVYEKGKSENVIEKVVLCVLQKPTQKSHYVNHRQGRNGYSQPC